MAHSSPNQQDMEVDLRRQLNDVFGEFDDFAGLVGRQLFGVIPTPGVMRGLTPYSANRIPSNVSLPSATLCLQEMKNVPPLIPPLQVSRNEIENSGCASEASSSYSHMNDDENYNRRKKRNRDQSEEEGDGPLKRRERKDDNKMMRDLFDDDVDDEKEDWKGNGGNNMAPHGIRMMVRDMQVEPLIPPITRRKEEDEEKEKEERERRRRKEKEELERRRKEKNEEDERKRKKEEDEDRKRRRDDEERKRRKDDDEKRRKRGDEEREKEKKKKEDEDKERERKRKEVDDNRKRKEEEDREEEERRKRKEKKKSEKEERRKKEEAERLKEEEKEKKKKEEDNLKRKLEEEEEMKREKENREREELARRIEKENKKETERTKQEEEKKNEYERNKKDEIRKRDDEEKNKGDGDERKKKDEEERIRKEKRREEDKRRSKEEKKKKDNNERGKIEKEVGSLALNTLSKSKLEVLKEKEKERQKREKKISESKDEKSVSLSLCDDNKKKWKDEKGKEKKKKDTDKIMKKEVSSARSSPLSSKNSSRVATPIPPLSQPSTSTHHHLPSPSASSSLLFSFPHSPSSPCFAARLTPLSPPPLEQRADNEGYTNFAKEKKHSGDASPDRNLRFFYYLESSMYFALSVSTFHPHKSSDRELSMASCVLKDTVDLIKHAMVLFEKEGSPHLLSRARILCIRTQAVLNYHMYFVRSNKFPRRAETLASLESQVLEMPRASPKKEENGGIGGKHNMDKGEKGERNATPSSSSTSILSSSSNMVTMPMSLWKMKSSQVSTYTHLEYAHVLWNESIKFVTPNEKNYWNTIDNLILQSFDWGCPLQVGSSLLHLCSFINTAVSWMRSEYEAERSR